MSVPDRSIKLLVDHGIKLTENEWMTIKLHDGLYDQANEPYFKKLHARAKASNFHGIYNSSGRLNGSKNRIRTSMAF